MIRRCLTSVIGAALALSLLAAPVSAQPRLVPEGNRNAEQPAIPGASSRRTAALDTSFERKYQAIIELLGSDAELRRKITRTAARYGIDPIHMAGALVGEHTYNVDAYDRLQAYYVKAIAYTTESIDFSYGGEDVTTFTARPEFANCETAKGSYALWSCREHVWDTVFRGERVEGERFPDDRFSAVFFQPFFAGQTFGLGQINPVTALKMSDTVARISGFPPLSAEDPVGVYQAIMDPDQSLAHMAAIISHSIDAYKRIANYDISANPGITATLYNVGSPEMRASVLAARNRGGRQVLPEENYYGWLVNDRIAELRALFPGS